MDSEDGLMLFFVTLFLALVVFFIFLMIGAGKSADKEEKRQDTRYEMCLEKGMQWIDENCISAK